jgi:protein-L-isoaspartate O-methyltransferase
VIPSGETREFQTLYRITRGEHDSLEREALDSVRFVPLVGEEGW